MHDFRNNVPIIDENNQKLGILDVCPSTDPDYPGIDVEFYPEKDDVITGNDRSRPRVLVEYNKDTRELRALIWNNPNSEDYAEEILLAEF